MAMTLIIYSISGIEHADVRRKVIVTDDIVIVELVNVVIFVIIELDIHLFKHL